MFPILSLEEFMSTTEDGRGELHVTGLVHTVHVAEVSGDGELNRQPRSAHLSVHLVDLLGDGVQLKRINAGVVHAIFLTAGDTNLHLEVLIHRLLRLLRLLD